MTMTPCAECGMPCEAGEFHPYAACLMFKACHNSSTVRGNLQDVRDSTHLTQPAQSVDVGNLRGDLQSIASGMFPDGDCADVAAMLWAEKWLAALQEKGK